jgi:hypothetical protein
MKIAISNPNNWEWSPYGKGTEEVLGSSQTSVWGQSVLHWARMAWNDCSAHCHGHWMFATLGRIRPWVRQCSAALCNWGKLWRCWDKILFEHLHGTVFGFTTKGTWTVSEVACNFTHKQGAVVLLWSQPVIWHCLNSLSQFLISRHER